MSWSLLAIQLLFAAVLLQAATGKAMRPDEFITALRLSHVPAVLVIPLAVIVPALELGLAVALVVSTPRSLPSSFMATAGLFAMFTVWIGWIYARHLRIRCGCFGAGSTAIGIRSFARNVLLIQGALGGAYLAGRAPSPLPDLSLWMAILTATTGATVVLVLGCREILPDLVLNLDRLRERTTVRNTPEEG